jgi:hypothetical protein
VNRKGHDGMMALTKEKECTCKYKQGQKAGMTIFYQKPETCHEDNN